MPPGTTSQVLIGGPSWGQVDLAHMVTGNLTVEHLNTGMNASSYSYWRGDGTWAIPAGAGNGNVNNYSTPLVGQVAVWMDEYTIQGLQTLPITAGGTGQTTAETAFDALSPMANPGDILYGGSAGAATVLPAGTSSQVLFGGTAPHWGTVTIATIVSANITDATALGREILTSSSAITTLGYLGANTIGIEVLQAISALAGRTALGSGTVGDELFTSATQAAALGFLGITSTIQGLLTLNSGPAVCAAISTPDWVRTTPSVRQTVLGGPNTSGNPNFLPATSASLAITTQNVNSTYPFVATAANGCTNGFTQTNLTGASTSNLTWSSLAASNQVYLYVTISSTGVLTTGSTTFKPIYQFGGTPSVTNGQFTFNYGEMCGYMGNGSSAVQAYIVFVGECTTTTTVTATVAYAYNGLFEGSLVTPLTTGQITSNSNLGVHTGAGEVYIVLTNLTAEATFTIGQQVMIRSGNTQSTLGQLTQNQVFWNVLSTGVTVVKSDGTTATLTAADWNYHFVNKRGW